MSAIKPEQRDVLLVIDVQNDFCPGGALEVPRGHSSFASSHSGKEPFSEVAMPYGPQTLWPDHCIQGSRGAGFHDNLSWAKAEMVIRKGFRPDIDSYSAFFENDKVTPTGLTGYLRERGMTRVFCTGLAFDYCVRYSAEDAHSQRFETCVIDDACRAIDMNGSAAATRDSFSDLGIGLINSADLR